MDELLRALMVGVELPGVIWWACISSTAPGRRRMCRSLLNSVAVWDVREGRGGVPRLAVGTRLDLRGSPLARYLRADAPVIFDEVATDVRLDEATRARSSATCSRRTLSYTSP
jgi:hypothetical protein